MDKSIIDICVFHHSPRFKTWAIKKKCEPKPTNYYNLDVIISGVGNYFEELLAGIRDIRSSEKVFWRKVLDIYATIFIL